MDNYDPNKESSYIMHLDANNFYGSAMSLICLSEISGGVRVNMIPKDIVWELELPLRLTLKYFEELHDLQNDQPLASKQIAHGDEMLPDYCKNIKDKFGLSVGKYKKLAPNLIDQTEYLVHYKNLEQYLGLGMTLTNVHRIIEFDKKPWMRDYITFNTEQRKKSKNDFEKNFSN